MILVDAGPLVALVDASDQHHGSCAAALREVREPLGTAWPALTEAMYLLLDLPRGQAAVWEMIERKAVRVLRLDEDDVPRIRQLMSQYEDRPMDLADAALVRLAEREGLDRIFTVDRRDFEVYRIGGRKRFRILGAATGRPRPRRQARSRRKR
jgi:predicted nucleic acid-binding protein